MYYLSFPRKTALFGLLSFLVSVFALNVYIGDMSKVATSPESYLDYFLSFMYWSVFAYPLLSILHIVIVKILRRNAEFSRSVGSIFFDAFFSDIVAPISSLRIFFLIVTRMHIISDDSSLHNFEDLMQVIIGFIWTVLLVAFLAYGFTHLPV